MEIDLTWFFFTFKNKYSLMQSNPIVSRFISLGLVTVVACHVNNEKQNVYILTRQGELFYNERGGFQT